jgi:orotidine-5'-phosphate decarboxylase
VHEHLAQCVEGWGEVALGPSSGLSCVGAVVGATYPEELKYLRSLMPHAPFLIPGYGAQGGTAGSEAREVYGLGRVGAEEHLARDDAAWRLDDLEDRLHRHALAASALADNPDHLTRRDVEGHTVHRAHETLVEEEVHAQVAHRQDRRHHWP